MDEQQKQLVNAVLAAVAGHEHPTVLRQALTWGFALVEEGKTAWYAAPETADEVKEVLPKALAYIEQLKAELSGSQVERGEHRTDLPVGMTEAAMEEIQFLASAPAPGKLRPFIDGDGNGAGNVGGESNGLPLPADVLARVQQLSRSQR